MDRLGAPSRSPRGMGRPSDLRKKMAQAKKPKKLSPAQVLIKLKLVRVKHVSSLGTFTLEKV